MFHVFVGITCFLRLISKKSFSFTCAVLYHPERSSSNISINERKHCSSISRMTVTLSVNTDLLHTAAGNLCCSLCRRQAGTCGPADCSPGTAILSGTCSHLRGTRGPDKETRLLWIGTVFLTQCNWKKKKKGHIPLSQSLFCQPCYAD